VNGNTISLLISLQENLKMMAPNNIIWPVQAKLRKRTIAEINAVAETVLPLITSYKQSRLLIATHVFTTKAEISEIKGRTLSLPARQTLQFFEQPLHCAREYAHVMFAKLKSCDLKTIAFRPNTSVLRFGTIS
jgi:hypothetical protein